MGSDLYTVFLTCRNCHVETPYSIPKGVTVEDYVTGTPPVMCGFCGCLNTLDCGTAMALVTH